ncbi:MAG: 23S rRNA (guanosine(2251)-2'-O)-methyltransferase RlmB [Gemmatimonadota bacterium]
MWVSGRHSVEELLRSTRQRARKVLVSESVPAEVRKAVSACAAAAGVPCLSCARDAWRRRTGETESAGVAAEIAEFRYEHPDDWMAGLPARAFAFLLDGVTDPQNLGAVIRNARAFAVAGVVVPRDRTCPVTSAVFRASAGAAAHVPVIQVTNLARAIDGLKERGFWVYAAVGDGETDIRALSPAPRTGFVLGSEGGGVRKLVREKCDGTVRIAMAPEVDSLNVAVASGILAFCARGAERGDGDA